MTKPMTLDEKTAKLLGRECPDKLIEIVNTYHGRTGRASARRACRVPGFIIDHDDGRYSVARLVARP